MGNIIFVAHPADAADNAALQAMLCHNVMQGDVCSGFHRELCGFCRPGILPDDAPYALPATLL